MVLRRQCRRLVGISPPRSLFCCPSFHRALHTSPARANELPGGSEVNTRDKQPNSVDKSNGETAVEGSSDTNIDTNTTVDEPLAPNLTIEDLDLKMTLADMGVTKNAKRRRRRLIHWTLQRGRASEHPPQNLVHEIEERRVEKIRKRAEDRMFTRMNAFFNSLTAKEIETGMVNTSKTQRGQKVSLEEPTSFQKLMADQRSAEDRKRVESKVLALLQKYDLNTWTMYKNYIDWSDFKLQKQTVWFKFVATPKTLPQYGDLITRLQRIAALSEENPERKKQKNDLENYVGPSIGNTPIYSLPAIIPHYFVPLEMGDKNDKETSIVVPTSPFIRNNDFKPWRPLSHKTRQQMFDAWREGLGLRNIAWMGGVSWRRVDGIIGILKREWDFVQQVISSHLFCYS
jgi:hypothetical protein